MLRQFLSTVLLVLTALVCLAFPSEAAIRSIDIGLENNKSPSIDEGQVAWLGYDGATWQVYFFNGSQIFQLSQGLSRNRNVTLRKGKVLWEGYDGQRWQIFYFNGYQVHQLTNSGIGNHRRARLDEDGEAAVWETYDGLAKRWSIWLFENGSTPRQISTQPADCLKPAISNVLVGSQLVRQAVWLSPEGSKVEGEANNLQVFFYNGTSVEKITKVIKVPDGSFEVNYDLSKGAKSVDIHKGQIVWQGWDNYNVQGRNPPKGWGVREINRWSIYLYKSQPAETEFAYKYLSELKSITKFDDRRPRIYNGRVVWETNKYATDAYPRNWDIITFDGFSNTRLTYTTGPDLYPVIRNGRTCYESKIDNVWKIRGRDWHKSSSFGGYEFYLSTGLQTARKPDIDGWGRVAWREYEGGRWIIKLYDGTDPWNLGNRSNGNQTRPRIHNGKVVFEGFSKIGGKNYRQIFLWDGAASRPITNDTLTNKSADIYGDTVCFLKESNKIQQVFIWKNGQSIPVTDSYQIKQDPKIWDGIVVWQQDLVPEADPQGIYACPVPVIESITDNPYDHLGLDFDDGLAAWSVGTGDEREIELWDGFDIIPLSANDYEDRNPDLRNGRVVWEGRSNGYWQIFLFTGTGVVQLTDNLYDSIEPKLDEDGSVVWQSQIDGTWQIVHFNGATATQLTTTTGLHKTNPVIDNGEVAWRGQYTHMGSTFYQIYRWANGQQQRLTLSPADCSRPQISNGRIVWTCAATGKEQVYLWNGTDVRQVTTSNFYNCSQVRIAGDIIVWEEIPTQGGDSEIVYCRASAPSTLIPLTENSDPDVGPVTDGTHIAWSRLEGSERKVYLSDGLSTVKVTDMAGDHFSPVVSNAQVVWQTLVDGRHQIRGWLPQHALLSDPGTSSILPALTSSGHAAWQSFDGSYWQIHHWTGLGSEQLSPSGTDSRNVALDGATAAWEESNGTTAYVRYFDGYSTRTLASVPHNPNFGNMTPQLHQGRVVWAAHDGTDFEIYYFDGVNTYQLTDNPHDDRKPQIHNGQVVWQGFDGQDYEIHFWDGSTTYMVSSNTEADTDPQIYLGEVVWQGFDGLYWQVYSWKWQGRPLFVPIGDKLVGAGQLLEFEVRATDPNGDPLTIEVTNLPEGAYFDPVTHIFSWTPGYDQWGTHYVFFTATDNGTPPQSTTELVRITVGYVNLPPEIEPIEDKVVKAGTLVSFTVTATDPNGEDLTFEAADVPPGANFDPLTATFSWVPDSTQLGTYVVTFTATDTGTPPLSDSLPVTIIVGDNSPPVLDPIGDKLVPEAGTLTFTVTASDVEGHNLAFSATNLPPGAEFNPATQVFTWTPTYTQAGVYTGVRFKVMDDGVPAGSDDETITITVVQRDAPPELDPIGDKEINAGQVLEFYVNANDLDGDNLTYTVENKPPSAQWFASERRFRWQPQYSEAGVWPNIVFRVTEIQTNKVTNSGLEPLRDQQTGEIIGDAYPWIFEGTSPTYPTRPGGGCYVQWTGAVAGTLARQPVSNPPGYGSQINFSYMFNADAATSSQVGIYNATDGAWVGTPSVVAGNGAWQTIQHSVVVGEQDNGDVIEVRFYGTGTIAYDDVSCRLPALTDSEAITITVNYVNGPPVLATIGNKAVNWGNTLSFNVHGYDPEGEAMTFECIPLPAGAAFEPNPSSPATDYIFTWTPELSQVGQHQIMFRITDAGSPPMSDDETITITVGDNHAPVINPIGDQNVDAGQPLTFTVSGSDPDGNSLSWACYPLPAGASFNGTTRTFTWTPGYTQNGTYQVTIEATDNGVPSMKTTQPVTITVNYVNVQPNIVQIGNVTNEIHDQVGKVGQTLQFPVVATDPNGESVTYSLHNAPTGASIDPITGIFTWTPTVGQQGTYSGVTFMATDTGTPQLSTTRNITITIIP